MLPVLVRIAREDYIPDINGDWVHARLIEGTLLVNVGELLSRWTDGGYKSTPHRVVNTSGRERLSIELAFDTRLYEGIILSDIGLTA